MKKSSKLKASQSPSLKQKIEADIIKFPVDPDEDKELAEAKVVIGPIGTNAFALQNFSKGIIGARPIGSIFAAMVENSKRVNANDLRDVEATLISQATVLNSMFGELVRRTANRFNGETFQLEVVESYFKMAMKAQNQCRMTLETLGNIKNPSAVFAKQANINNGGQQQVNNGVAPHAPATENQNPLSKVLEQSIEQRMDTGTQSQTGKGDSGLEAVAKINRP